MLPWGSGGPLKRCRPAQPARPKWNPRCAGTRRAGSAVCRVDLTSRCRVDLGALGGWTCRRGRVDLSSRLIGLKRRTSAGSRRS